MNLLNYMKKPILLFSIGIIFIMLAVFLKQLDLNDLFKNSLFISGLIVEGIAIGLFIKNKIA